MKLKTHRSIPCSIISFCCLMTSYCSGWSGWDCWTPEDTVESRELTLSLREDRWSGSFPSALSPSAGRSWPTSQHNMNHSLVKEPKPKISNTANVYQNSFVNKGSRLLPLEQNLKTNYTGTYCNASKKIHNCLTEVGLQIGVYIQIFAPFHHALQNGHQTFQSFLSQAQLLKLIITRFFKVRFEMKCWRKWFKCFIISICSGNESVSYSVCLDSF